jgi:hypothetical protein
MLRPRAVRHLLVEEVAGIRLPGPEAEDLSAEALEQAVEAASKRALVISALLVFGLVILLLSQEGDQPFLVFEGAETVFSVAALVVSAYAGFRIAQWRKYRRVARALQRLPPVEGE